MHIRKSDPNRVCLLLHEPLRARAARIGEVRRAAGLDGRRSAVCRESLDIGLSAIERELGLAPIDTKGKRK